jgi:hypothetical protein
MSERTSFNPTKTKVHIGFHENSAFTPMKKKSDIEEYLTSKKDAFAYIKGLFNTYKVLPDIKK